MELCQGDLDQYVKNELTAIPKGCLDKKVINGQMALGLAYLHTEGIAHRDLKPKNILLCKISDSAILVKLADFGLSKQQRISSNEIEFSETEGRGTSGYMAPEVESGSEQHFFFESDVWALGVLFYLVLSDGKHPYGERILDVPNIRNEKDIRNVIIRQVKSIRSIDPLVQEDWAATDLVIRLLNHEAAKRPKACTIVYHPYFILANEETALFLSMRIFDLVFSDSLEKTFKNEFKDQFTKQKIHQWYNSLYEEDKTEEDQRLIDAIASKVFNYEFLLYLTNFY